MIQLLWLRNDLRLNDNEGFRLAIENKAPLSVIYILPKHWLQEDCKNMTRLGAAKASFLRAALIDLHRQLENQTIQLHIYCGDVVDIFSSIFEELFVEHFNKQTNQSVRLLTSHPQAPEERDTLTSIQTLMAHFPFDSQVNLYDSQTLFSSQQCQAFLDDFPSTFTAFRKHVEGNPLEWHVTADINTPPMRLHEQPLRFNAPVSWPHKKTCSPLLFAGGESNGKEWLAEYLWKQEAIAHYKRTRNALTDTPKISASSSHLSAYLAWGCLSPRYVWHEILKYEAIHGSSEHTYWLKFELLWREYFHWSLRSSLNNPQHQFGSALFCRGGIQNKKTAEEQKNESSNENLWQHWCAATTGVPMVDAGLRELQQTGFISNRLRQNMASYFIHQLQLDWRLGARWFEMHLIDFDVASNYGNWAYIAGVGHDARPQRQFNLNKQLQDYDPELTHIRLWCPELIDYDLHEILQHQAGAETLPSYPIPVVPVFSGAS